MVKERICILLVLLTVAYLSATGKPFGQRKKKPMPSEAKPSLQAQMSKAKADVIAAANEYKASLKVLLQFQEDDVASAASNVEKQKALLAQGITAKRELEESEQKLYTAQAKVSDTKLKMGETDNLIAEASGERQLQKLGPSRVGAYQATAALIRYNGPTHWALSDAAKVEVFFTSRFNHTLPISAFGQTAVHDHLGFDHRNAMDVAVSPDSSEGKALMDYLRSQGIPFIAFHYAVPGSATGAHIHIGLPSKRIR